MFRNVRSLRLWAAGALATAVVMGTAGSVLFPSPEPVRWGVWLAAGLALPSYGALSVALRRSNAFFFSVFLGGMFMRLIGLAGGVVAVWRLDSPNLVPFALSAVLSLAGLSLIEVYFIGRQSTLPQ